MIKNDFLKQVVLFLPLLLVYLIIVLVFSTDVLIGDESRHFNYALNLTNGYYVNLENPNFRNGPGYPLALAPLVAIGCNLIVLKILNAFFLILAVFYFKKSIALFTKSKLAIIAVYFIALYPPVLRWLPFLYSEPMAYFLMCGLIFHVCKFYQQGKFSLREFYCSSIFLGLLLITKIVFLQVVLVSAFFLAVFFALKRRKVAYKSLTVLAGGFLFLLPYLIYAYSITGKFLYIGSGGGEILYHRATPYPNEWGNWFSREDILFGGDADYVPTSAYKNLNELSKNHRDFYMSIDSLTFIERDSAFKAAAITNMKQHPKKYLKNTVASFCRLVFHYPFSYRKQSLNAYGYMLPNMIVLVLLCFSFYPFMVSRKKMPFQIIALLILGLIYTGGIVLLDGRGRNFIVVVPVMVLFFTYVYSNLLRFKLIEQTSPNENLP